MLNRVKNILGITFLMLSLVVLYSGKWVLEAFGDVTFSQIVFAIMTSGEGTSTDVLIDGIKSCLIIPAALTIVLVLIYIPIRKYIFEIYRIKIILKKKEIEYIYFYKRGTWIGLCILCMLLIATTWMTLSDIGAIEYYKNISNPSVLYEEHYVDPKEVDFEEIGKGRNLIYIVLESVETTYASTDVGGVFDINRIPELTTIYQENQNFSGDDCLNGFTTSSGTGWTAGSLTAQLLGVPLTLPIDGNSYVAYGFLPGAYGIGDILDDFGYNSSAVLGSDSDFGGRTMLYKGHGIDYILDYKEAIKKEKIAEDYRVWWGYEDDKLFEYCKEEVKRLSKEDAPFFFTTLTVDTHFEDGYVCKDCPNTFDDQYSNVITCSDKKVAEFVRWVQDQEFYENTTIIIAGDHLTMDSDYLENISEDYIRTVYYTIINSVEVAPELEREYTTMDLMPTALASIGLEWEGDRLALGTNLFGTEPTLMEELGLEQLNEEINRYSEYYYDKLLYDVE